MNLHLLIPYGDAVFVDISVPERIRQQCVRYARRKKNDLKSLYIERAIFIISTLSYVCEQSNLFILFVRNRGKMHGSPEILLIPGTGGSVT